MINTARTTSDGASDRRVTPRLAEINDDEKPTTAIESPPALGKAGGVTADEKESQTPDVEAVATDRDAYSAFTVQEKRMIVVLVCLASIFSPLSANVPPLPPPPPLKMAINTKLSLRFTFPPSKTSPQTST
jgi:hypothetical protein